MQENKDYKLADYLVRSKDYYALTKYQIVMGWLPNRAGLRVLNAGCGSGEMNILLAQNPSWQVDAIDVDESAIQISQELKVINKIENLNIFRSDIKQLPDQPDFYNVIVSNDVLEHIDDDSSAIEKLAYLLKPGGVICISVPALQWLFGNHDVQLGHFRRYNKRNLIRKFRPFFEVKKCRYFAAILIPIALLYSCWLKKPYPVGDAGKESLVTKVLKTLLAIEAQIPLPVGTSLILLATKKSFPVGERN